MENPKVLKILLGILIIALAVNEASSQQGVSLSIDKPTLSPEEKIHILIVGEQENIDLSQRYELWLYHGAARSKYLGALVFPLDISIGIEGQYELRLLDASTQKTIDIEPFVIEEPREEPPLPIERPDCADIRIATDRSMYSIGQDVIVSTKGLPAASDARGAEILITSGETKYRLIGDSEQSYFRPEQTGEYTITLLCGGQPASTATFSALEKREYGARNRVIVKSSSGEWSEPKHRFLDVTEMRGTDVPGISDLKKDINRFLGATDEVPGIEIEIGESAASKLRLEELVLAEGTDLELNIEDVPEQQIAVQGKTPVDSYAMDLSNLEFTYGTFTKTAQGTRLWKCAEWDYDTRTCTGTWIKILDIIPGTQYTLEVSPGDPGYAETGVTAINTKKPIYKPGETAQIITAVLDTQGFLVSGASVTITVTDPENATWTYDSETFDVLETRNGIYELSFGHTGIEGNYTIAVSAIAPGVNSSLSSMFSVQSEYDFDIIRDSPMSTDPATGPFESSINVFPYVQTDDGAYNFTEVLPAEFDVVSAPGAIITSDNNSKYLSWTNLQGNSTVGYSAQPPMVIPNLFELGKAFIRYVKEGAVRIFEEFRSWFLAIDPQVTRDQGLFVYGASNEAGVPQFRNWTGSSVQAEENANLNFGENMVWMKFRCLTDYPQCLLVASDTGGGGAGNDHLNFAVFYTDNWTWGNYSAFENSTLDDYQSWDVECEDVSSECLIVYEDGIANDAIFQYFIWTGTGIIANTSVSVSGGENNEFNWIKLYPKRGTDTIGIALQNDGGGADTNTPAIYAGVWNGSAFGNWQTLTTASSATGDVETRWRHFDCAWEANSTRFLCFYANNSLNGILGYAFNGTAWQDLGNLYTGMGSEVWEMAACGQEFSSAFNDHNNIGLLACDSLEDLDGLMWNGTAFHKQYGFNQTPYQNVNAECATNKGTPGTTFGCKWEDSGTQAVFVWVNSGNDFAQSATYTVSSSSFSITNWSLGTQFVTDGAGDVRNIYLSQNQQSDYVMMTYSDGQEDGGCSIWKGASWDSTSCNSATAYETSGAQDGTQWNVFDWFRTSDPQPLVTIITPNGTQTDVNFSSITSPSGSHKAYNGSSTALPPAAAAAPVTGTEFSSQMYSNISASDDARGAATVTGAGGLRALQSFNFTINDSLLSMSTLKVTHEGYATEQVSPAADQFYIYFYNWSSDAYVLRRTIFASAVDVLTESTELGAFSDFIRNRVIYVLVEGDFATGAGGNARAEVLTDFIGMTVTAIPLLSGNITINASAFDDDDVSFCEWMFWNTTGYASNYTRMSFTSGTYYVNVTDTRLVADGVYNLTVYCNDTFSNRRNDTKSVRIDNTAPNVLLYNPQNNTNSSLSHMLFSWNVTDLSNEILLCNLTMNAAIAAQNVLSPHATNTSYNVTSISDGTYNWSVTCLDDAGNYNTSEVRRLDVDRTPPTVTAVSPAAGAYYTNTTVILNYTTTDSHPIVNCTLYFDGTLNYTSINVSQGSNNFTINNVSEALHTWNVTCFDSFGFRGNFSTRNFTLDASRPAVVLNTSTGITFNNTPVVLNYTAFDNMDTNMSCNITINGILEATNIPSLNATLVSRSFTLADGLKFWNVTCVDNAGNYQVSQTRTFQVVGGPKVSLNRPANGSVNGGINVVFNYSVSDGDGIASCALILDGQLNQTNQTAVLNNANNTINVSSIPEGNHTWTVNCTDPTLADGSAVPYIFFVDKSKPQITLLAPSAGQIINYTPTLLNFTLLDTYSRNATCNITIDGSVSASNMNFPSLNGSITQRSQTVTNGMHFWNVTCIDEGGNFNISSTQNFTVNVTFPLNVTVIADKVIYQEGEIVRINATVRNETGHTLAANVTLDYIYTNVTITDVPWWNTSWRKRKPIYINETNGTSRSAKPIALNVTELNGEITSCTQLRVISDGDYTEVAFNVLSGDNFIHCYIVMNVSVSANAVNEQNYHVYYNNTLASDPGYPVLTAGITLFSDDFADAGTTGWTTTTGWDRDTGNPLTGGHAHVDGIVTNTNMSPSASFDLTPYDEINVSVTWEIETSWDANEYIMLDFTNNSGTTWFTNISFLMGQQNEGSTISITRTINSTFKKNGFNVRFRATTDDTGEDGGFDDFSITAWNYIQANVSSAVGYVQVWLERNQTQVNTSGLAQYNYTTLGKSIGNYSAVALASTTNGRNRDGTGYDWFTIINDLFGPVVNLTYPPNDSTNHTGNMTFMYTAFDLGTQIANCSIYVNGILNSTNSSEVNSTGNSTFFLENMVEGTYFWFVSCSDSLLNIGNSSVFTLYLDDTPPVVRAIWPNATFVPTNNVTFTINVTDNLDTSMFCNVSVDSAIYSSTLNAVNASNSTVQIVNIANGFHTWNATCWDNINNSASSDTLNFTVDQPPSVTLFAPSDGYGVNATNISLFYNVTETALSNCTLLLNGVTNDTANTSQIPFTNNDGSNNFTFTGIAYGAYNWSVQCVDTNGFSGSSETRTFQLDNAAPNLTLNSPVNNDTLFSSTVLFNFTATDIDPLLSCNLTINGTINRTGINATSGANTFVNVTNFTAGSYNWSVSCVDNTGFSSDSETRNFSIVTRVVVTLVGPANNSVDGDGSIGFQYIPQSINTFTLGYCDIYLDDVINDTQVAPTPDVTNTITINNIGSGSHSWYINCTDNGGNTGRSETRTFIEDGSAPNVTLNSPNATAFTVSSITFNWTATDNVDQNMTCNVAVNGTQQSPGSINSPNGTATTQQYSGFTDGLLRWNVTCTDDALRNGTSATFNFTVQEPPKVSLNSPTNNSRTRSNNSTFYYTPTDNSGALSLCRVVLDSTANQTNSSSMTSGSQANTTINGIVEGVHNWTVNCTDPSGNSYVNTSIRILTVDQTPPNISLVYPAEGQFLNTNDIAFNWSVQDYDGITITCNLTTDGVLNRSGITGLSNSNLNFTVFSMLDGPHNWSVACWDDLNNTRIGPTGNFTINQPDLDINDSQLGFNNTNPNENDTINITANVSNFGGVPANNVIVTFYDGLPSSGGIFIANVTGNVSVNGSRIFSTPWNITQGYHAIYALVDYGGLIGELNESNNNATRNISILRSIVHSPLNGSMFNYSNVTFNFTVQDFTGGQLNYTVFVDNSANGQSGQVNDNASTVLDISLSQGVRNVMIEARDSLGRRKNSSVVTVTVDFTAPNATINTQNATWFNTSTPLLNITIRDNVDANISYRLFVNETINASGFIANASTALVSTTALANGSYIAVLEGTDDLNNSANSSSVVFYVDTVAPTASLVSPSDGQNLTSGSATLIWNVTDNMALNASCIVTLDGSNITSTNLSTNMNVNYTANSLSEATHHWNVTCIDPAQNQNTSLTRTFNVFLPPIINLISPANATWTNNATNIFVFNVSDTTGIGNCSLLLNGVINQTLNSSQVANNAQNNFTVSGMNGTYGWAVECYDNATQASYAINGTRNLYVDLDAPNSTILTVNDSWFRTGSPNISFVISDNMDTTLNYTFYVNGSANINGSSANATNSSALLTGLVNGTYMILLEGRDEAGNRRNSSSILIGIDTVSPFINLTNPANNTNFTNSTVELNYTVFDNSGQTLVCNVTLDGSAIAQNQSIASGGQGNATASGLSGGFHYWNATCIDRAGNYNTSLTYQFYILRPDIYANSSLIFLSNANPIENETINVTSTLLNNGNTDTTNFVVQFWRNAYGAGGVQVGSNITMNLSAGESRNVTVNYTVPIGRSEIFVVADAPLATNGSVQEENESNNIASRNLSVSLWHFTFGQTSDRIVVTDSVYKLLFDWNDTNSTGSHIFVTDSDASINWELLQALGLNISNTTQMDDFEELDVKLNSTNFSDSINVTYTSSGARREIRNYTIYGRQVMDVPVSNSTNNTNFKTGILWDYGDGGPSYNSSQDVLFISEIMPGTQGYNATVDFEIRVPATLRQYFGPDLLSVDFYMEII